MEFKTLSSQTKSPDIVMKTMSKIKIIGKDEHLYIIEKDDEGSMMLIEYKSNNNGTARHQIIVNGDKYETVGYGLHCGPFGSRHIVVPKCSRWQKNCIPSQSQIQQFLQSSNIPETLYE